MSHNKLIGEFGEDLALRYLLRKKYKLIGRNIQSGHKEIDIIANDGEITVFVEVKTRLSGKYGRAEESLTSVKIKRLTDAAKKYIYRHKLDPELTRIDLVAIDIDRADKKANIKHFDDIHG